MMVETITEHSRCVSLFNVAAEEGRRKAIYTLSCQKTLASVRALSKQSLDKCPTIQGVCHYANKVFNENNDALPSWLMARIIKYLIYRAREESIGRLKRLADLEREIDEEYLIMQTVADFGQPGSKKFDEEMFDRKANTKLRKRGEEWREAVYVDDAPLNGPNLYIILTGFHDPDLPEHLINVGVPLSCMMQIKRPNERLNRNVQHETVAEKCTEDRIFHFLEEYTVGKTKLFNFWTKVKKRMMDPEAYPEYCDIGFLVFCPPQLPETSNKQEYEALKKDMYDRVSYIVYDFYDVYRQHGNYLKSMKVEKGIVGESAEKASVEVYETLLHTFPPECVSVPLILFAILMQVEANVRRTTANSTIDEKGDARATAMDDADLKPEAEITPLSAVAFVEQKVKILNIEYGLDDEEYSSGHSGQNVTDIALILREDSLGEAICLMDDSAIPLIPKPTDLIDHVLSIFRHPIVESIRKKHDISGEKLNEYTRHIDNIRRYFDVEISVEEVMHHLHILIFDKMLHRSSKTKSEVLVNTTNEVMQSTMRTKDLTFPTKRSKSLSSLVSESTPKIHFLSDGNFDYGKMVPEVVECSSLFDLIDPRELLVPGYLEKNVLKPRATDRPRLGDFSDIELLSKPIFLQLLHECLLAFDHVELRYFEPTDSLLLYFRNKWEINGVSEEERMSSIRTPVRLRDFCKYVVPEEKDWLRREEEQYRLQTAESMERLMRKNAEIYDETMLFRDEDFILPGTLKAKDLEARRDLDRQKSSLEVDVSSHSPVEDVTKGAKKEKAKGKEEPKKGIKRSDKSTGRKSSAKRSIAVEGSPSTMDKLSQVKIVEKETTYDFIGYDLGRLRVQVTNRKKTFYSADDTLVQVETDDWLYKTKHLQITVTLRGCSLRLFHRIDKPETIEIFHLTTRRGIILAFQKLLTSPHPSKNNDHTWQYMNVESRISWPTGLLIESVIGDGPENPYYIRQLYVPKGHADNNEDREICRKFLRNATVLKYLSDGSITVFRPNGVIVNCTAFEKTQAKQHESHDDQARGSKSGHVNASGDRPKETKLQPKTRRKPMSNLKSQLHEVVEGDSVPAQQNLTTGSGNVLSMMDSTVKVSRYTVLNHDGRWYEVHDDLVVSEQHRLLVRMASDYEVDEKFTRRADGTNMLLNSNGELIVRFPGEFCVIHSYVLDGTRITTGYAIEKEPVMCDWTEEEILRYFASDEIKGDTQNYVEPSFSNHGYAEQSPFSKSTMHYEEKITELSITDSFVSVLLTCRMEHKNYATVSYDQSAVNCTLSMPDDLRVSISRRGHYEVSMADGVNLKINEDNLSFQGNSCTICGKQSTSTYNFFSSVLPTALFTTVDVFGNILEVKDDGETNYHRNVETSKRQRRNSTVDEQHSKQQEYYKYCEEEFEDDIAEPSCNHEALCFTKNVLGCRMFSINRELTAYEYIHRLTRNQIELVAVFDDDSSIILYPSSHRPMLRRLITLEPVAAKSRLKNALSFPDFKLKPTNFDRGDILRSTYSIPYDWLFPFGRNGNGIWKNTHDLPLMDDVEALPELLRIRILRGFKEPGGNALVGDIFPSRFTADQEREITKKTSEAVYGHLEDNLHVLSLGIKKTIDVETYKIGLKKQWTISGTTARRRSMNFDEFLGHKDVEREKLEWYKRCMREKFILPYFENITGMCFLWIMDSIENAMSGNEAFDEIGEN
ncbi:Sperm-associated antigen 17 [Eufriesea mexicana]|uniref:Sperm-associated antigen 17 n=1 Tax=Eufriesea mexicana TaxID=516756 RepID=A0A310SVX3_9HYME|nr:Sperm-associated antigen 17 [Eufriesea mexicana]